MQILGGGPRGAHTSNDESHRQSDDTQDGSAFFPAFRSSARGAFSGHPAPDLSAAFASCCGRARKPDALYIILAGRAKVVIDDGDGREVTLTDHRRQRVLRRNEPDRRQAAFGERGSARAVRGAVYLQSGFHDVPEGQLRRRDADPAQCRRPAARSRPQDREPRAHGRSRPRRATASWISRGK